jgi:nitrogen fixation NifU-like protein
MEQAENDRWDRVVAELQREIEEKERALYSARVLEQARNPENLGRMEAPDAHATITGWCGDTMEIYLRLNGSTIQEATFLTDGCGPSVACGNMLTTMVQGIALNTANRIDPADLILALDGLPEESAHCAELAVNTLRQAIASVPRKGETDTD